MQKKYVMIFLLLGNAIGSPTYGNTNGCECIKGNCINGDSVQVCEYGVARITYTGQFKNGELHGMGYTISSWGNKERGLFENGTLRQGVVESSDGSITEGTFDENGQRVNTKITFGSNLQALTTNGEFELIDKTHSVINKTSEYYPRRASSSKPKDACSPDDAEKYAIAACAIVMGGCGKANELINKDNNSYEFLGDLECSALAANLRGNDYEISDALKNSLNNLAMKGADQVLAMPDSFEAIPAKLMFGTLKLDLTLDMAEEFQDCVSDVEYQCSEKYKKWLDN